MRLILPLADLFSPIVPDGLFTNVREHLFCELRLEGFLRSCNYLGSTPRGILCHYLKVYPLKIGKTQETIHAIASPAGSESGCASKA